jgi:hypothetical protein
VKSTIGSAVDKVGARVGKSENSTVGVDVDTVGSIVVGTREGYIVVTLAVG